MSTALTLHSLFSDQAVLPRDVPLPVFGRSVPGQTIKVSFAGQQITTKPDASGAWLAMLPAFPAGGPHTLTVSMASRQLIRRDIMVGDVWLAVGHRGMDFSVAEATDARAVLAAANLPKVRLLTVPAQIASTPVTDLDDARWEKCVAAKLAGFSSLAFHFAKTLSEAIDAPIGIIQATHAEAAGISWVPADSLRGASDGASIARAAAAMTRVKERSPGGAYHGMIAPLTGFPIRGVIAWQGENDIEIAQHHRALCSAQIQGWRAAWRRSDLPFLFVQAIGEGTDTTDPADSVWAELREAQAQVGRLPGTALVVGADRTESVAPAGVRDPRPIAERLMLSALAVAYRRAMPYSGPILAGHVVKNGAVHLRFDHAESGLRARAPGPLLGFAIAGADRVFRWGDARFENGGIVVSHPAIPTPVAVRYGWAARPVLSVENGAGLPAVPFRTDNWAGSGGARRG